MIVIIQCWNGVTGYSISVSSSHCSSARAVVTGGATADDALMIWVLTYSSRDVILFDSESCGDLAHGFH